MIRAYKNKAICTKCGGRCCRSQPGAAFPKDFDIDNMHISLAKAFKTGNWAIDWWEGDPTGQERDRTYFVRPAIKDVTRLFDPTWGGECIFLDQSGCKVSSEQRPKGCRELEPKKGGNCIDHSKGKQAAAIAWIPYEKIILKVGNELQ